jgi:WD40 repeat protein
MSVKPTELLLLQGQHETKAPDSPKLSPASDEVRPSISGEWQRAQLDGVNPNALFLKGNNLVKEVEHVKEGTQSMLVVNGIVWIGCCDGTLALFDIRSGKKLGSRQAHKGRIFAMCLVNSGNDLQVWTASDDNKIKIWNYRAMLLHQINIPIRMSCLLHFHETEIWVGAIDSCINIYDTKTFELKTQLKFDSSISIRHLFKHKHLIWVCTEDHVIRIHSRTHQTVGEVDGSKVNKIVQVSSTELWGGSSDTTIKIWDAETGRVKKVIQAHDGHVFSLLYFNGFVWSAGWDKTMRIWNTKTYEMVSQLQTKHDVISSVILVPNKVRVRSAETNAAQDEYTDLYTIWSGSWNGNVFIWL